MRYEAPEVTVLPPAIKAIQTGKEPPGSEPDLDSSPAYEDWE